MSLCVWSNRLNWYNFKTAPTSAMTFLDQLPNLAHPIFLKSSLLFSFPIFLFSSLLSVTVEGPKVARPIPKSTFGLSKHQESDLRLGATMRGKKFPKNIRKTANAAQSKV